MKKLIFYFINLLLRMLFYCIQKLDYNSWKITQYQHNNPHLKCQKIDNVGISIVRIRDDNFSPPLPASPRVGFPCLTKVVWRGWDKILARTTGQGGDGFRLFRPTLPCPAPTPSRPVLLRVITVNFSCPKILLFNWIY